MASFIRPNRTEVNRTFPWLGFTIRTAAAPAWFEVAVATDPSLFEAEAKSRRTAETFFSTRPAGPLPAPSGEAVWIVPPAVLARFAGSPKLFYALATFASSDRQAPEIVRVAAAAAPSVALSRSFTGVTRRLAGVGGRSGDAGPEFGSPAATSSLEWAGDLVPATAIQPVGVAAPVQASALDFDYSDGFGPLPPEPHLGQHRYPAQALGGPIDIYWNDVELVGQPTNVSCWAAAAAMVVGWRDLVSINPDEFARHDGRWAAYDRTGLSTNDNDEFAAAWRLEVEPPADPTVDGFARMLENKGPLWVGRRPAGNAPGMGHAVCVIGLEGDGTPDGTFVHWHDPWPPGRGTQNMRETYTRFLQEFDDFVTVDPQGHVNNQILHAAGTTGHTPSRFGSASAQGLATVNALGTFDSPPVTRTTETVGDISYTLENWDGMKYPPGVVGGTAAPSSKRITIEGPRYDALGVDAIYANVDLDFQFDGRGVGKVAMRMGEHSDAVSKGVNVTAHIVDDARSFQGPSGQTFGAIRITIDYTMTQVVADDVQAQIDVMLYGGGDYDVRYHMVQGSFDHMPAEVTSGVRPSTAGARAQAIALGAFDSPPVTRSTETSGDLTMNLENWDGMKYPPDVPGGAAAANAKRLTVEGPRYTALGIDNIWANIDVDFQHDGRGVGKVAMRMGEHSDAITKGLNVTAHIVDDARNFVGPSGQTFAGIRITIDYTLTQVVADDVQAQIDVMLYGSGDYDVRYHMVQGSFDHMPTDVVSGVRAAGTPARAQAIALEGGGGAGAAIAGDVVGNIAGVVVQRIVENVGDLTIAHESWNGMRYPAGVTRGNAATTPKQITIQGPRYNALYVDAIFCDLTVDFEYDGRGVGKVATRAGARSDAVGKGLNVQAHIVDDARTFTGGSSGGQTFAGIRITLEYSFEQTIADDIVVHAETMLYGNGDYDVHYHLIQGEIDQMPGEVRSGVVPTTQPATPQASTLGAEDILKSIGGFIVERFDPTADGIHGALDQWPRTNQRGGPAAKKFPFDDPNEGGAGGTQHQQLTIDSPHSTSGNFCDLLVSWDYNGRWLTNVNISTGRAHGVPLLERLAYTFSVTAKIDDVPGAFVNSSNEPPCAGLRINIEWRENRPVLDNVLVTATLTIFGNGGYMLSYSYEAGDIDNPAQVMGDRYHPAMRAIGRATQSQALADANGAPLTAPLPAPPPAPVPAPVGALPAPAISRSSETRGAVRFELDQYQGVKQPGGSANGSAPMQTTTIAVAGPRATDASPDVTAFGDCEIAYDFDGHGLGNVHVRPTGSAGTRLLEVVESIADDPQAYVMPGSTDRLAALRVRFEYRFDNDQVSKPLTTDIVLYGNGRQDVHYDWPHP